MLMACTPSSSTPTSIKIDGSSTVHPITQAVADAYKTQNQKPVEITVSFSGTTGGFRQFCEGKTDISNASRPIDNQELSMCNRYNGKR
jgi:phosphate transport system substrate-binding protein